MFSKILQHRFLTGFLKPQQWPTGLYQCLCLYASSQNRCTDGHIHSFNLFIYLHNILESDTFSLNSHSTMLPSTNIINSRKHIIHEIKELNYNIYTYIHKRQTYIPKMQFHLKYIGRANGLICPSMLYCRMRFAMCSSQNVQ